MTLQTSAAVTGLSSFVCLAFLTLSLSLPSPFYLDYMLLFPVFAPAPLDSCSVWSTRGLPFIFDNIRGHDTTWVPGVSPWGLLEPLPLANSWATESCPSFPWILSNQHSTNLEFINTVCISLTSYLRLSPKVPISSTAWTGMLPCSLKFNEGSGFLSSSWSPWEMKWSTS